MRSMCGFIESNTRVTAMVFRLYPPVCQSPCSERLKLRHKVKFAERFPVFLGKGLKSKRVSDSSGVVAGLSFAWVVRKTPTGLPSSTRCGRNAKPPIVKGGAPFSLVTLLSSVASEARREKLKSRLE